MLLSEIRNLDEWFKNKEEHFGATAKLTALNSILKGNIQGRHPNNRNQQLALKPFTEEKNNAIEALNSYTLTELSQEQIQCLAVHDAQKYMGPHASTVFSDMFKNEVHDLAYLQTETEKALNALNSAKSKLKALSNELRPYSDAIHETTYLYEKARLSIIFKDDVKIESLKDLEAQSKEWSVIIHGIGVALGVAPDEFKVLGARNGSLVIDLYMTAAAIVPIGFILNRGLAIIERVALSLKRIDTIYDLDGDDPQYKELADDIITLNDRYFSIKKTVSSKEISKDILDKLEPSESERPEAETHLDRSIRKIFDHLRKGGDLDVFIPTESLEDQGENETDDSDPAIEEAIEWINEFRHKKLGLDRQEITKLLQHLDFEEED